MPTNRRRRTRGIRPDVPEAHLEFLLDGGYEGSEVKFFFSVDDAAVAAAWESAREELLREWIADSPGSRPWGWWTHDAPRWGRKFGAYWDGLLPEPRRRLGGKGTPAFEALNVVPAFRFGIPCSWVSAFDVSFYNGRSRDVHGNRIGEKYEEGNFPYDAIDPADPPAFESQAAYLQRHRLFLPGEENRIPAEASDPEVVRC